MSSTMELVDILDLETIEDNLFRGRSPDSLFRRVYGGQVIAQALVAAQRTVDPSRLVHSLHCYFILGGDRTIPILYQVEKLRDGGSFTTRRVTAIQRGQAIFSLQASFHVQEPGLDHQEPAPLNVPPPEGLKLLQDLAVDVKHIPEDYRRFWAIRRSLEIKPINVEHYLTTDSLPPQQLNWIRINGHVPDNPQIQSAALGFLSDMTLLDTSTFAHGRAFFNPDLQMASLDHAMWFHRPNDLSDWLLYVQDSPSAMGARGFTRGLLYARDGTLVASVAQEGLIRLRSKPAS